MPTVRSRRFSREFKLKIMERISSGEVLSVVAQELGVHRQLLYKWRDALRRGEGNFPRRGRPTRAEALAKQAMAAEQDALAAANRKIADLERKVGQQALELDFFLQTLRRFKETRPAPSVPGVNASLRRSKR
jgi:transposase-like protein